MAATPTSIPFSRLTSDARQAISCANAQRKYRQQDALHMEHLLFGLLQIGGESGFKSRGISRTRLLEALTRSVGFTPADATIVPIDDWPKLSRHVRDVLSLLAESHDRSIDVPQLVDAALRVENC